MFGVLSYKQVDIKKLKNDIIKNDLRKNTIFKSNDKKIFLYNENLGVINLSKLTHDNNSLIILTDGEIYNCNEIIEDLTNKGYKFKKYIESEVIAYGYAEYGDSIFNKLNGAFSLAIYNRKVNELILVRDKFGSKPLFYNYSDNEFIFSSELNDIIKCGIKKEINNYQVIGIDNMNDYCDTKLKENRLACLKNTKTLHFIK